METDAQREIWQLVRAMVLNALSEFIVHRERNCSEI